jgi:hypothetical protein
MCIFKKSVCYIGQYTNSFQTITCKLTYDHDFQVDTNRLALKQLTYDFFYM